MVLGPASSAKQYVISTFASRRGVTGKELAYGEILTMESLAGATA
jgi:hypothetical protein